MAELSLTCVSSGTGSTTSDAIIGGIGITVTSGTGTVTIDGHIRYTSAENPAIIGGTNVTVVSGANTITISSTGGAGGGEQANALVGDDGITVTSGTSVDTITGFRTEFVNASGSLQNDIDTHNHDERYYTQTELNSTASGSAGTSLIGFPTVSGFSTALITNPVSPSLQAANSFFFSAGLVTGGDITDLGDETILVASGIGAVRTQDNDLAPLVAFGWAAASGIAIGNNTVRFIGVSYNSVADTATILNKSSNTWDYNTEFPLGLAENRENEITIALIPHTVGNTASILNTRFEEVEGPKRADALGGMILSESADALRNIAVSAGTLWFKLNRFTTPAIDTSGSDTFDAYYRDGVGGFTQVADETQWDNDSFDDDSGTLATLTNNRYANLWFYLEVDGTLSCIYGRLQSTKLADVELEPVPDTLPTGLVNSILLGRLVFFKDDTIATDVQVAFDTSFNLSGASDHGNLAGLLDDDHPQYVREDGSRGFSATVSGVAPVDSDDLTTKNYVDTQDTTISGHLQSQLDEGEITSINGQTGPAVTITGVGAINTITTTNLITITGTAGGSYSENLVIDQTEHVITHDLNTEHPGFFAYDIENDIELLAGIDKVVSSGINAARVFFDPETTSSGVRVTFFVPGGGLTGEQGIEGPIGVSGTVGPLGPQGIQGEGGNPEDALTGSDGITIVSGSNTIDVVGFRAEFVSASGSLSAQIYFS